MLDFAARNMNVGDTIDSLLGVENVASLQDEGIRRGIHTKHSLRWGVTIL